MRTEPSSESIIEDGLVGQEPITGDMEERGEPAYAEPGDEKWLALAREADAHHREYFDTAVRRRLEDNYDIFNSRHPLKSKYRSAWYAKRSRLFRPKTRANIRKLEAQNAVALFSTADVIHCSAENEADPKQRLAASVHQALLQYRLEHTVPWYMTVVGAFQEAAVTGVVVSKQEWRYREVRRKVERVRMDAEGNSLQVVEEEEKKVLEDTLDVRLIPLENIGLDPSCDWRDPINSSPYLIEYTPLYVGEIKERMKNPEQVPRYRNLSDEVLSLAMSHEFDSIRQAREGENKQDRYDKKHAVSDFDIVWVHHNIIRRDGEDYVFDTLGTQIVLSDAVPIDEVYPTKKRPYQMGHTIIEAHKVYTNSPTDLQRPMNDELNDLVNMRLDNIRLALNKRYFARRGAVSDLRALIRNVAGGVVFMNDPEKDVKVHEVRDVTSSAYAEQDRLNLEMDDLVGSFTGQTVMSNRKMNETVGGMNLLSEGQNQVAEFTIRTFVETWLEPVLRQCNELEAAYESDEKIMALVGAQVEGENGEAMDESSVLSLLDIPVQVRVNVGYGATNPVKRVEKLSVGLQTMATFFPNAMMTAAAKEVGDEVFGALGYRDSSRFFPDLGKDNPEVQELQQQIAQLEQVIQTKQVESEAKIKAAQIQIEGRKAIEEMRLAYMADKDKARLMLDQFIAQQKARVDEIDAQIAMVENEIAKRELWMQREALSHSIRMAEREFMLNLQRMQVEDAQAAQVPPDQQRFIETLQTPPSGQPYPNTMSSGGDGAPDLPGDDMAGTISRGDFGLIPGQAQ